MRRPLSALLAALIVSALPLLGAEKRSEKQVIRVGQATGARLAATEGGVFLRLASVTFDPLTSVTDYSTVGISSVPSSDYGILQLDPGQPGAREALVTAGVELLGYLPDHAFRIRLDESTRAKLSEIDGIRWVGPFLPGYKVDPSLWNDSADQADEVLIALFPGEDPSRTATRLEKLSPGAFMVGTTEDDWAPRVRFAVPLAERPAFVAAAAELDAVAWIEPWREITLHNNSAAGPIQSGITGDTSHTIFAQGLTGTGQIVAVADSGADVDMCFFRNLNGSDAVTPASSTVAPELGTLFPTNKVIGYWVQPGADAYDNNEICGDDGSPTSFHGTHVSGSAVGDNFLTPSTASTAGMDPGDGMAPNAQLLFQDIGAANGCLVVSDQISAMFEQAYRGGARLHNNSYGSNTNGAYTSLDSEADRFLFDNPDMAIFVAAGNAGPVAGTVGSPGVAKNVVSVGALGTADSKSAARFSSRGPTVDGRLKPEIMAPGTSIVSAWGDTNSSNGNCGTQSISGTSMASPLVTGAAALLRQYFSDGFYPTGKRSASDAFEPSGTLVKAALLNGTLPLPFGGSFRDTNYGWGRIFLDSNLYFEGDDRDIRVFDLPNTHGLQTGESHQYQIEVPEGEELRVTLTWFDPEATFGAATQLVNNLDLTVTRGETTYLGNVFSATGESESGGAADAIDNTEQVRFSVPSAGTYTVAIKGTNVPGNGRSFTDRQGYALVVSAARCSTSIVAAPTGLGAATNPIFGVDLSWTPAPGSTATQIYRAEAGTDEFRFIGTSTGASFTDRRAQGGATYVYKLRGVDGCGEGPLSQGLTVSATGACDLVPRFFGLTRAIPNSPDCSITLEWAPATAGCTLGDGVNYNIYRSTTPGEFPDQPLATVANVNRFVDVDVESGTTYYYIVRAEDRVAGGTGPNGGNEETNSVVRSTLVIGPPGDLGTWTDDGGDTRALLTGDFPWRIAKNEAQAGSSSYHSGTPDRTHPADTCASLSTPPLMLGAGAKLTYWARFNLEFQWDGVVVEISSDGGANWTDLPPAGGYPGSLAQTQNPPVNACGYPSTQGAFTGPASNTGLTSWAEYSTDLSSFEGKEVMIRWRLTSDPGLEEEGLYLDTISITNVALPGDCLPVIVDPVAEFSVATRSPQNGIPVSFADDSQGNPQSWLWNFGDGSSSTLQNPSHTFAEPGTYTVTLTVTNSSGTDTKTRTVRVFNAARLYAPAMLAPGQARAQGNAGSFFRSAFWLTNLSATESVVRLRYLPTPGTSRGGADETILLSIAPGQSRAYGDVLSEALGANANTGGVLVVEVGEGTATPIVTARTYNEPSAFSGTFGQYIPAMALSRNGALTSQIDGLGADAASRSNVGVANLTDATISATITLIDAAGQQVGSPIPLTIPAHSAVQENSIHLKGGVQSLPVFSARITATGSFFAYASKLDNKTSDPIFIPDTLRPLAEQWVDGVGATAGGGGTFFRSNLSISNRGSSSALVRIDYFPRGTSTAAATKDVAVPAGQTVYYADALTEIFGLTGAGMFRLTTAESTPVVAWVRTFNDRGANGTLGQFIPGFGRSDLIGTAGGLLQGLSDNDAYRTNMGLINVSSNGVGVTVEVWEGNGAKAGESFYAVPAGQTLFLGSAVKTIAGKNIQDGYVVVRPGAAGAVYAWASYVDNRSTDQTFVRPLPIP